MKFIKIFLLLVLVISALGASAQSSDELKRRREKLNQELEELNRQADQVSKDKRANLKQLSILKAQINLRTEKIGGINKEIGLLDNQITQSHNSVSNLQKQLNQLKKEYAAMVLFAYHNKSQYNKMMFVFAASDFNQAYKRLKYLQQFGTYRERQANAITETQNDLHVKINQLDNSKKEKSNLLQDQEKEKASLGKERNDEQDVIAGLSRQQGQIKQQQLEKQRNITRLNSQIAAAIRREVEAARRRAEEEARRREAAEAAKAKAEGRAPVAVTKKITSASTTREVLNATPEAARLSNDFLGNKGRLPWPVANSGGVVQGFGRYSTGGITNDNKGIDIRTSEGASVRAVFDGEVNSVTNIGGTYVVLIRHGEFFTVYSNLRSVSVSKGQKVDAKQTVGSVAEDPASGMPIAHFELWRGSDAVNPSAWLAN